MVLPAPLSGAAGADGTMALHFGFDNSYARLPARFHAKQPPTQVTRPAAIRVNAALAAELGLDAEALASPEGTAIFAGNHVPDGAEPLAAAYAGHQFGHFVPQLGDGRAILLGEVVSPDGTRRDIQLKGSGPTPFSRSGDGRAALGPVLREYMVSEAMAALGIPTTRALAAVTTGETVYRQEMLPGAVFTRVAASHIRCGTFQYFAARQDTEALRLLADHVIARHYPHAAHGKQPYRAMLEAVVARQADLIARWLLVGFIHGVMNTDNMSVAGETIDYGPCAFMDAYDPATVFSSIDHHGRYAYANQPSIAHWNLVRLAEAMLALLGETEAAAIETAKAALSGFAPRFKAAYDAGLCRKLGLEPGEAGNALAQDLLERMTANAADFTLTFRALAADAEGAATARNLFADPAAFDGWAEGWRAALAAGPLAAPQAAACMRAVNPAVIPRNHMVEDAIAAAVNRADFAPFATMLAVLADPFSDHPTHPRHMAPPQDSERVLHTFCGT